MRASGIPVVRMNYMSCDAMAKKLFLDMEWPAEEALAAAEQAKGDWHQLRARKQLCPDHNEVPHECSGKDASVADAPPSIVANHLLNDTAPDNCPLDPAIVAWTETNLGVHCDSIENMADRLEAMAAANCLHAGGSEIGDELFRKAAQLNTKRVHYQPGLYAAPYTKAEGNTLREDIKESFQRHRATTASLLKKRALEDETTALRPEAQGRKQAKARATRAKPKPRAKASTKPSGPC